MAEPRSTAPAGVAPSQQAVLLTTKLYLPRPQQGFVARPRLVDRMEEALARGIVLVCAPAGFGKTNLLGDWARRGRHPVAWLSLDQGDNDPAGSGATPSPRWTGCGRGSPSGSPGCWARRRRRRSTGWSRP